MTKVLITDPIDQTGIDILSQVAQVDQKIGISDSEIPIFWSTWATFERISIPVWSIGSVMRTFVI